ncbi:3,4-dihydroxy 2-butanone 4-phosphate synthase/GTP cyclohydrolase II [Enterococcus sp. AZ147]
MSNITEAIKTLKKGGLIIVADDEDRESEGDLVGLAEYVTPEAVNFMIKFGRGLICAPISKKIAQHLSLEEMTTHNTDAFGTAFTISVDHKHRKLVFQHLIELLPLKHWLILIRNQVIFLDQDIFFL